MFFRSTRTPGPVKKRSARDEEEAEDLTKDMEDPPPEPNIQEVHIPKNGKLIVVAFSGLNKLYSIILQTVFLLCIAIGFQMRVSFRREQLVA